MTEPLDPHTMPTDLVTPAPDHEGAPQAPTKRRPWSKPKVQTRATLRERHQFRKAARRT